MSRKDEIEEMLASIKLATPAQLISTLGTKYRKYFREKCCGVMWSHPLKTLQLIAVCLGGKSLSVIFRMFCADFSFFSGGAPDLLMIRIFPYSNIKNKLSMEHVLGQKWNTLGRDDIDAIDYDDLLKETTNKQMKVSNEKTQIQNQDHETFTEMLIDEENTFLNSDNVGMKTNDLFVCTEEDLILPVTSSTSEGKDIGWCYECVLVEVKGPTDSLSPKQLLWLQILAYYKVAACICNVQEPEVSIANENKSSRKKKKLENDVYVRMCN